VLVAVLALIVAVAVAGSVLFATQTLPPLRATYDFTDDLHRGRTADAFARVCDDLRTPSQRDRFAAFAALIRAADSVSVDFLSVRRDGDHATVEFDVRTSRTQSHTIKLRLVNERGDWRPCGADPVD